jgi:hypothetical protein
MAARSAEVTGRRRSVPPVTEPERLQMAKRLADTSRLCGGMANELLHGNPEPPAKYRGAAEAFRQAAEVLEGFAARLDGSPGHLAVVPDADDDN